MIIFSSVLAILTIVLTALMLSRPKNILILYAITRPIIQPFIFLQHKIYFIPYSILWAVILPISFIISYFHQKNWRIIFDKSSALLMMIFFGIISMPLSVDMEMSIHGLFKMFTVYCAFSIAYNSVNSFKDADRIINSLIFASIIPLLYGFYQAFTGNYNQIHIHGVVDRVNSVFGVGNAYGIYLSITMCATLIILLKKDLTHGFRLFYFFILSLMIVSQILALNRGTWIAFSVATVFSIALYMRKINIKWFIISGIIITVAFSGIIYKRFTEVEYRWTGEKRDTFRDRVDTWNNYIPIIEKRPILGYGVGTTGETDEVNGIAQPHNDYVRLATDIGIPGAIVYLYFLVSLALFYQQRQTRSNKSLVQYNFPLAILSCYMIIISMTQNIFYNLTNFVFFMFLNGTVIKLNLISRIKR